MDPVEELVRRGLVELAEALELHPQGLGSAGLLPYIRRYRVIQEALLVLHGKATAIEHPRQVYTALNKVVGDMAGDLLKIGPGCWMVVRENLFGKGRILDRRGKKWGVKRAK